MSCNPPKATFESVYRSVNLSAVLITAEYTGAYSENDFNAAPAISFPVTSCYEYKAGNTKYLLNTNHILFEKGETEFTVSKFGMFSEDVTLCIPFSNPGEELNGFFEQSKNRVMVQRRSVPVEILLRRFLSEASGSNATLKEQLLIDLVNRVVFSNFRKKISEKSKPYSITQVDRSKDFIHAFYHENLRIADIAAAACLSPFYFSRLFRQVTGYAPYDYLLLTRIENAKLLLQKNVPVMQAAFSSGFNSLDNFSYAFSRITGDSPTGYKKGRISKM